MNCKQCQASLLFFYQDIFLPVLVCVLTAVATSSAAERLNIVLIMADDMNDGCCCNEEIARENHCFSSSSERN